MRSKIAISLTLNYCSPTKMVKEIKKCKRVIIKEYALVAGSHPMTNESVNNLLMKRGSHHY
jgi:hypothetical protein